MRLVNALYHKMPAKMCKVEITVRIIMSELIVVPLAVSLIKPYIRLGTYPKSPTSAISFSRRWGFSESCGRGTAIASRPLFRWHWLLLRLL